MNWCLGGLGSGLAVSAWVAYVIGQISMQATHQLQLIAGVMMLAGLFFVWLKLGRRWRAWRALWRPQTSWMTRELYAAGVFLISVLVTTQISQPVVGLYHLAGFAAACFLLCQARILHSAKGIPAWRTPRVPWLIVVSGLFEGVGLTLLLVSTNLVSNDGTFYLDPSKLAGVMVTLAVLNMILWLGYRYGADRAVRPPLANRIVDNMSWPLLIVGHLAPVLLALAAWFHAADTSALLATAGFLVIAGGTFWKCGLILKASYQHGFTLSRLPQRGSGTRAAPSLVA
ncbi:MAG: polysulfide reductase NrfD [Gammaproteobacteria bacterium]|nr:polysulfide reductase NrfD [Gammaproteobacteria bacterium]